MEAELPSYLCPHGLLACFPLDRIDSTPALSPEIRLLYGGVGAKAITNKQAASQLHG